MRIPPTPAVFRGAGRRIAVRLLLAGLLLGAGLGACTRPKRRYKPAVLATRSDVARYIQEALEHNDPDVRRSAVEHISRTRHAALPAVVDAFGLIARTDTSESVRRVSIRALGCQCGKQAVRTMVLLITGTDGDSGIRPAGEVLRSEAMSALCHCADDGLIPEALQRDVRDGVTGSLARDRSRGVRIAAAEFLGHDPEVATLHALIAALHQADFGVVYQAERSLMRLTGVTHQHDESRWTRWLQSTADPFAQRGALDDQLDSSSRKRWWWGGG